jgi:uroporphyrinogen III methyltransferase/synthase
VTKPGARTSRPHSARRAVIKVRVDETTIKGLSGRTIILPPANSQRSELVTELERYGARVIASPTIEIAEPDSYAALDEAIENIYGYDWLIVSNVNAVDFFLRRFQALGHETSELDSLLVCAIGHATVRRLGESHIHVDLVAAQFKAEDILAVLEPYTGDRESLGGLNLLIPRAADVRNDFSDALEAAGARTDTVAAYRAVRPKNSDRSRINALLAGGGIDCLVFTSCLEVQNFAELFDTSDLPGLLAGVAVACIDQDTAKTVAELGLDTKIIPAEFTVWALARAIEEFFR